jgi:hypothetical protein
MIQSEHTTVTTVQMLPDPAKHPLKPMSYSGLDIMWSVRVQHGIEKAGLSSVGDLVKVVREGSTLPGCGVGSQTEVLMQLSILFDLLRDD